MQDQNLENAFKIMDSMPETEIENLTAHTVNNGENGENGEKSNSEKGEDNRQSTVNNANPFLSLPIGDVAVFLSDAIVPTAISAVIKKAKNVNIDKKRLQATESEKAVLSVAYDDYLKTIDFQASPLSVLVLTIGIIYGMKTVEILNSVPEIKEKQENVRKGQFSSNNQPEKRGRKPKVKGQVNPLK